jgi:hypothetical protein
LKLSIFPFSTGLPGRMKKNQQGNRRDFEHGNGNCEGASKGYLLSLGYRKQGNRCRDDL